MHHSSLDNMGKFIKTYNLNDVKGRVLDIGSKDINGSYRDMFPGWEYTGLDIVPGKNVDIVLKDPYEYPFENNSFDVVISGQAFEHIEDEQAALREIVRVLIPGGYLCIIAPSMGPEHNYPKDYRRYTPGSMKSLAKQAGLTVLEAYQDPRKPWFDCVLIAVKPSTEAPEPKAKGKGKKI